ncbi:response regulator transcription factor [Sphingobium mellinum]|uniref:response regulator transcription factor n=1 Tax=Sphingobium mellinum TaxID=1387166 RepID=UPI0030ECE03E
MQFFKAPIVRRVERDETTEASRPLRRRRILLVDEDPTARAVMARRLSHLHYDVAVAENGFVALNRVLSRSFDIILIDMGMTTLPGIATMKKIRAAGLAGQASFVMITGRQDSSAQIEALEAGADDHIAKPFDFDVLDARLRHLCVRAEELGTLARHNAELDARIARRAVELGETREAMREMQADRARLVSSIQALNEEIARLSTGRH